jgi:hypothetical protein
VYVVVRVAGVLGVAPRLHKIVRDPVGVWWRRGAQMTGQVTINLDRSAE